MGFSDLDSSKCRRHPNHKQLPGVCSSCLREKLSKLRTSTSFNKKPTNFVSVSSSQSSTPPFSSASSSSTTTTGIGKSTGNRHRRNGSEAAYVSVGMVLNDGLKKSKSLSCAPLSRNRGASNNNTINEKIIEENSKNFEGQDGNPKKKSGFLKKLVNSTNRKTKGVLTHSRTMKERSHPTTTTQN